MLRLLPVVAALALAAPAAAASPSLGEPFDVVPRPGGTFLVTDRAGGRVLLVDPARKSARRVASVPGARELAVVGGGFVVTSGPWIVRLDVRTGRTARYLRAHAEVLGIAPAPGGGVYASEGGTTIVRLAPGGRRTVLARGLYGVHGITVVRGALLLGEAYAGRVLRLDLRTRRITVLARGLGNPSFVLRVGSTLYVSEFEAGRISRLGTGGRTTTVATVDSPGPIALDGSGRIVGVTLDGTLFRVEGGRARTLYP